MKTFLSIVTLLVLIWVDDKVQSFDFHEDELQTEDKLRSLFERWARHYPGSLSSQDENKRFEAFKVNALYVHKYNIKKEGGNKAHKLGLNQFSDLTTDEFTRTHGCALGRDDDENKTTTFTYGGVKKSPPSIDWRTEGAVTPVKNQFKCASCWAFGPVAAVEGINFIRKKRLVSLSEQELVDCEKRSHGCTNGKGAFALDYIKKNGVTTEDKYPYKAKAGRCLRFGAPEVVRIDGHEYVPRNNEAALRKAVAHQPVVATIDAGSIDFKNHKRGYLGGCVVECLTTRLRSWDTGRRVIESNIG